MGGGLFTLTFKICFITSFLITSIVMLTIAIVLYVSIRPFNKRLYRSIIWYLLLMPYAHVAFVSDWWSMLELDLYMDKEDFCNYFGKEHALLVINHSYDIDWLPLISICARKKFLSNIRMFVKRSLQYIPIIGWSFILTEFILLHRSYKKDEKIIRDSIRDFATYPYPIWLVLYPEGTWFTKESHKTSKEFAEKMNLPQLKYHLQPRTNGFVTTVREMRGHIRAIYNVEIAFKDGLVKPCAYNILEGKTITAHIYIERIAEENIPIEKQQQENFLREIFQIKDKLRDNFNETGSFVATDVPIASHFKIERPFYIVPIFLGCCLVSISTAIYCIIKTYYVYGFIIPLTLVTVISICFLLIFTVAIKSTEIEDT